MTESEFELLCDRAMEILRKRAPYDTGNLSRMAIQKVMHEDSVEIFVNMDIAPYMPYTNEPWVSDFWKGKQNPNLYWFDDAVKEIAEFIASSVGGDMTYRRGNERVDEAELAEKFQNKRGDYHTYHVPLHSFYITNKHGEGSTSFETARETIEKTS